MRLLIGFVVFFVARVVQSAIMFSSEAVVSAPVYAPAVGDERAAAAVSDGTNFLVLWNSAPLYVTWVSASGSVRVPPVALRTASYAQHVSACWTGSVYLVTWTDLIEQNVMLASVSRDGRVITPPHVMASQAHTFSGALAWNGRHAFLIYATTVPSYARAALMDSEGVILRTDVPLPFTSTSVDDTVKAASDGSSFGVIWRTSTARVILSTPPPPTVATDTYRIARVSDAGQLLDPAGVVIGTTGQTGGFGITYGGGHYALAALERRFGEAAVLLRFKVDAATLQTEALPPVDTGGFEASVTWNGTDFIAYWMNFSFNAFKLIAVAGMHQPVTLLSGDVLGIGPILVSNGNKFLVTWTDRSRLPRGSGNGGDLFGAFVDQSAASAPSARFDIGLGVRPQWQPAIATSGLESLAVWIEQTNDSGLGELFAARMNPDGSLIDTTPLDLGSKVSIGTKPAVVFTGSAYFVVWEAGENSSEIVGRRIEGSGLLGAVIDFGAGSSPALASTGTVTLIVFTRYPDVLAVRLDQRGEILDSPPVHVATSRYYAYSVSAATNGSDFLVVWTEGSDFWQFPAPQLYDVLGVHVTHAGSVDAAPIPIATGPKDQRNSAIVSDGRDYLVLYLLGPFGTDVLLAAKRVLAEGSLADTTPSDDGVIVARGVVDFSVARDTDGYAVAWQTFAPTESLLQFAPLDPSGNRREVVTIFRTDSGYLRLSPALASKGAVLQLAYARPAQQYDGTLRVFIRFAGLARARAMRR